MIKSNAKNRGFTIVELLVVIVVIGILAAITMVSYTGVTAKANTVAAQSAASAVISKANIYYAEKGIWPATYGALTTAASTETFFLSGISFNATANLQTIAAAPTPKSQVLYEVCGVGTAAAATSYATVTTITGLEVDYYKFDATAGSQTMSAGTTTGTVNTYAVSCWSSAS